MRPIPQFPVDLVTFTEEILNGYFIQIFSPIAFETVKSQKKEKEERKKHDFGIDFSFSKFSDVCKFGKRFRYELKQMFLIN